MSLVNQTRGDKFTQLENVSPLEQQAQKDVIRLHQARLPQPVSNSPSSSLDSSESSEDEEQESDEEDEEEEEDEDDEEEEDDDNDDDDLEVDEDEADHDYAVDEDEDEGEDGAENEDDANDEDDESQEGCNVAIVDPVGNHIHPSAGQFIDTSSSTAIDSSTASVNDDEYYDVPYVIDYDESSVTHSSSTSDLLYSERMLEVTRALVRSTERDPDRDLRKQVLLRTALRKLPHFMTYNHYSETFDQSFQMHNNTVNDNNNATALECLSPSQYYEHHSIHHLEQQPKSYYHSVQPNALQMSTTSLRMLDLNDDSGAEVPATGPIETNHQDHVTYESTEHVNANSNLYSYSQHNGSLDAKDSESAGYGVSMQETSPNSKEECDSELALFSHTTNKRTSSSIGLDEQMEIDNTGTVANQYKKLKKRESSNLRFTPSWANK